MTTRSGFAQQPTAPAVNEQALQELDAPAPDSVFVPSANDLHDPSGYYKTQGYEKTTMLRVDVATRTSPGVCTPDDMSGCTLQNVKADNNSKDSFKVDIPVSFSADDFSYSGVSSNALLRQRGDTSRSASMKSFRIRLDSKKHLWRNEQRLQLNKHPYDPTRITNKLCFDLMAKVPYLPSLRTQFVNLWIDDGDGPIDQGLYTHVEAPVKEYLINRGNSKDDNLYKADNFLFSTDDLAEMALDVDGVPLDEQVFERRMEIKRGKDHRNLIEMITAVNDPEISMESLLDQYFNRNNILMWMSMNLLMGQHDVVSQNFYLYNPTGTKTFYFLPWDYDLAFRTQPELKSVFDFQHARDRLSYGFARWAPNRFLSRYLRQPGIHSTLLRAAEEVRNKYLSDESIKGLVSEYALLVRPMLKREPDLSHLMGVYQEDNFHLWDQRLASLPGVVASNLEWLRLSPNMPLPHQLEPPKIRGGNVVLAWSQAHEVGGHTVHYDLEIAHDPAFDSDSIVYRDTGITDKPNRIEYRVSKNKLPAGTWYYRVWARVGQGSKGFSQLASTRLLQQNAMYIGVQSLVID
ncbi:MAG: CotH kinase family protein [Granulosicoccus sp.]